MVQLILLISIFSSNVFFVILTIFGSSYGGLENGSYSYWIYLVLLLAVTVSYFLFKKISKKTISIKELFFLYIYLFFYIYVGLYNTFFSSTVTAYSIEQILLFVIFSVPSILAGWYFSKENNNYIYLSRNLEVVMLVFTIGIFISTFMVIVTGKKFESIGGASYQSASYIAAFSFGLNLFYLLDFKQIERYKIFENKMYKFSQIILLVIQVISVILGGGRGAFVLLVSYIIMFIVILTSQKNFKKILQYSTILMIASFSLKLIINIFSNNKLFIINGINRILAFVSTNGINWDGTSGRDAVYNGVVESIIERPMFGMGYFNYPYPHNLFLEILVSSGIIGLLIFMFICIFFFKKLSKILRNNANYFGIVVILMYPLVMLMFSGSIFKSPELWFVISFVYFFNPVEFQKNNEDGRIIK